MPISSNLGYSAVARPGVCTSSTRPAAPFQGQVIYETDTGRTLVWNSTAWVFLSTGSTGDLGLVKVVPTSVTGGTLSADGTITVGTAVTTVAVTGAFSAAFDAYKILYKGGTSSTKNDLAIKIGAASSGHYARFIYADYGSGAVTTATVSNAAQFSFAGCQDSPNSLEVDIFNPFLTQVTQVSGHYVGPATDRVMGRWGGFLNNSTSYTDFSMITNSGTAASTITGGSLRIYGYRN